jgi:hypothetical protein
MAIKGGGVTVTGTDKVLKNLNSELSKIKMVTKARLYTCGLLVKGRSVKITPIKYGNLRGSAYVTPVEETARGATVEIGYTAYYAPYVHEMPTTYNYTKAGTGPKFLEKALRESKKEIIAYLKGKIV